MKNQSTYYDYQGDNILIWEFLGRRNLLPPMPKKTKKQYNKEYYQDNREKLLAYQKEYDKKKSDLNSH